jgi:hypothetical protein
VRKVGHARRARKVKKASRGRPCWAGLQRRARNGAPPDQRGLGREQADALGCGLEERTRIGRPDGTGTGTPLGEVEGEDGAAALPGARARRAMGIYCGICCGMCCGGDADVAEAEPPGRLGNALQIARKAQSSIMPGRGTIDAIGRVHPMGARARSRWATRTSLPGAGRRGDGGDAEALIGERLMSESAQLNYGAGLLACTLAEAGADNAQLTLEQAGEVLIILRKGGEIVRTGRVPPGSSFVRWAKPTK